MKLNVWGKKILSTGAILFSLAGASMIAESAHATVGIRIDRFRTESQGNFSWCWAAVTEMMLFQQKGTSRDMCEIASDQTGKRCCGIFTSSECTKARDTERVIESYGVSMRSVSARANARSSSNTAPIDAMIQGLKENKLVVLRMNNLVSFEGNHVVVVHGVRGLERDGGRLVYNPRSLLVQIYDPATGYQTIMASDLMSGTYRNAKGDQYYMSAVLIPN